MKNLVTLLFSSLILLLSCSDAEEVVPIVPSFTTSSIEILTSKCDSSCINRSLQPGTLVKIFENEEDQEDGFDEIDANHTDINGIVNFSNLPIGCLYISAGFQGTIIFEKTNQSPHSKSFVEIIFP